MNIVDAHCHIYPEKIAERAVQSVGDFYALRMGGGDGSAQNLLSVTERSDISNFIVYSVALKAGTVASINDFIAEQATLHPEFIGFATMHPDFEDIKGEVERCIALGLKGFKLHPDSQTVDLDDPRLMPLYEAIEGRLPIVIHMGDYRYDHSHPRRLKELLHAFPHLVVNAAHFGGWSVFDLALEYLEDERCFLDVSSSIPFLGDRRARELIEIYGYNRILFGSDYPMWDPADELAHFRSLGFSAAANEQMLLRNAERFIGEKIGA
ncbi:MAG: amidohydrolase family protein [Coriobacteriales bacterium]|jgi:predicted TIM-barrel fold metal-dependent hydrolase|nr:amidohydrolase family protein [Coriobacteriales bacterium]